MFLASLLFAELNQIDLELTMKIAKCCLFHKSDRIYNHALLELKKPFRSVKEAD